MTLQEWIDKHWRRPDEPNTRALERLAGEWGITYKTLFYAAKGSRVGATIALQIQAKTEGLVRAETLILAPTRAELEAASAHPPIVTSAASAGESAS